MATFATPEMDNDRLRAQIEALRGLAADIRNLTEYRRLLAVAVASRPYVEDTDRLDRRITHYREMIESYRSVMPEGLA